MRANSRRVEALDSGQHLLSLLDCVERQIFGVAPRLLRSLSYDVIERADDIFNSGREIAVIVDVSYELVGEEHLPRRELEQTDLIAQVIAQIAGSDCHRLEVFTLLVLFTATASSVEAIEQDLFPVDLSRPLVFSLCLRLLLGLSLLLLFLLFLRLNEIEEGVVEKLLFEVLLQVQQRHVKKVHRLIKARIYLELLAELC